MTESDLVFYEYNDDNSDIEITKSTTILSSKISDEISNQELKQKLLHVASLGIKNDYFSHDLVINEVLRLIESQKKMNTDH